MIEINVFNHTSRSLSVGAIKQLAGRIAKQVGFKNITLAVVFVRPRLSQALNQHYRSRRKAANILTFAYKSGRDAEADIIICFEELVQDARKQNLDIHTYLAKLLVHGILHARGFTHKTAKDLLSMERKERSIMKKGTQLLSII